MELVPPSVGKKRKQNLKGDTKESPIYDRCQTPPYALDPLLPYIHADMVVWEPAAGEGYLARGLERRSFRVIQTELLKGENFFDVACNPVAWDIQITNPPFSTKYPWIERSYQLGKPFALLLPLETLGAARAQKWFETYGMELILMTPRVSFKMPNKGWAGSSSHFPVAWFTSGLRIGRQVTYAKLDPEQIKFWKSCSDPELFL